LGVAVPSQGTYWRPLIEGNDVITAGSWAPPRLVL
jgi:hypothetical protein